MHEIEWIANVEWNDFAQRHLKCQGKLLQLESGYLYLKISDDFIYRGIAFVQDDAKKMPDYFKDERDTGAHISVVYPEELTVIHSHSCVGHHYTFELGRLFKARIQQKIYFGCVVEAPSIIRLRSELGLDEWLNFKGLKIPLHITLAVKDLDLP